MSSISIIGLGGMARALTEGLLMMGLAPSGAGFDIALG